MLVRYEPNCIDRAHFGVGAGYRRFLLVVAGKCGLICDHTPHPREQTHSCCLKVEFGCRGSGSFGS